MTASVGRVRGAGCGGWARAAVLVALACPAGTALAADPAGTGTGSPAVAAGDTTTARAAAPVTPEEMQRKVAALEEQVARLQAEIARLRAATAPAAAAQEGTARAGAGQAGGLAELEKRLAALTREVEALRAGSAAGGSGAATGPGAASGGGAEASWSGLDTGASKPFFARRGLTVGGYGSALYQNYTDTRDDDTEANVPNDASLGEAFLYFGYRFDDHWVFDSSIGLENALAGDGEGGDATVEFAFIDYSARKEFGARGGLVLLPLGFLNERHEPNAWMGTLRPVVEERVIPTTWREVGGGVYGEAGPVQWRAFLTTGLDASGFAPEGVAGGRQQGAEANATDLAWSARVDWTPLREERTGRLLVGASAVTGKTGQKNPGFPAGRFTLWDAHAEYRWHGLQARALVSKGILSDAGDISLAIDPSGDTAIGERMSGWYAEVGYDVLALMKGTAQALTPFCRYESLDTQDEVAPGFEADPANDLTVKTCGVAWNPIPQVLLTVDAMNFDQQAHTAVDQINLGLGWQF